MTCFFDEVDDDECGVRGMQGVESTEEGSQESKNLKQEKKRREPVTEPEKVMMLTASDVEGAAPLEVEGGAKSGRWRGRCARLPLLKD